MANGAVLNLNYIGTRTVDNLYTNGSALLNGAYNTNNLPGFITGSGSILVTGAIPRTPANIKLSVSAGNLSTSWPPNYQGWVLQQQTNPLNVGLGTNWVDIAGTADVTSTNIPLNPATPMVFYRLRYPTP
jgi:hypothetical protein